MSMIPTGVGLSPRTRDLPARLLQRIVRWMPGDRAEWGAAMIAELDEVEACADRWRFALGCMTVALHPPRREKEVLAMANGLTQRCSARPGTAALLGALCVVPFVLANAIVANSIEPFFSMIRPNAHTSAREYVLLAVVLLVMPVGAYVALRPSLLRSRDGKRRFLLLNAVVALLLVSGFVVVSIALGSEIYACDVLQIPNCD